MKTISVNFSPRTKFEEKVWKVYSLLVENFSETYFVGGYVRDQFMERGTSDFDIATISNSVDIKNLLESNGYQTQFHLPQFGTVAVETENKTSIEITTFRKEVYTESRYPKISFCKSIKEDAKRRDFTINTLYFKGFSNSVIDYYQGVEDIDAKSLSAVGDTSSKLSEDPLRIIRAWRLSLELGFDISDELKTGIDKNIKSILNLSDRLLQKEIDKVSDKKDREKFSKFLTQKVLDLSKKYIV